MAAESPPAPDVELLDSPSDNESAASGSSQPKKRARGRPPSEIRTKHYTVVSKQDNKSSRVTLACTNCGHQLGSDLPAMINHLEHHSPQAQMPVKQHILKFKAKNVSESDGSEAEEGASQPKTFKPLPSR